MPLAEGKDYISASQNFDTYNRLVLGKGITPESVEIKYGGHSSYDLTMIFNEQDKLNINGYFAPSLDNNGVMVNHGGPDEVYFSETGQRWSALDLANIYVQRAATDGDDTIYGTHFIDTIGGGSGNDVLIGYSSG